MNDFFSTIYGYVNCYGDSWDNYLYDCNGYTMLGCTTVGITLFIALLFYLLPTVRCSGRKWWLIFGGINFVVVALTTFAECCTLFNEAGSDEVSDCSYADLFGTGVPSGLISLSLFVLCSFVLCFFSTHNYKVPFKM